MQFRIWSIIILLAVGLAACNPSVTPTPLPTFETELAEPVPVTVERILPTVTSTPQPMKTAVFTQTASPIPPTITSTPTPLFVLPENAADTPITHVILSSRGQLAYIRDEILYVETAPQTGEFEETNRYVFTAAWSPDGSQIVYSSANMSQAGYDDPATIYDQRLWSISDGSDISLSELIANYPDPAPRVDDLYWTPDGTKILMGTSLNETEWEENNHTFEGKFSTVDLNSKTVIGNQLASSNQRVLWLTDDVYILRYHCGSPCATISAYDYSGNLVWSLNWDTGGFVDFAPNGNFMINVGRIYTDLPDDILPTLDNIDLATGNIEVVWEFPTRDEYFTAFLMPSVSLDEEFFTFNWGGLEIAPEKLYIVNQNGDELGQYEKSYALDWRNNDDLAVNKILETGESQLSVVSANGSVKQIFTTNPDVEILGGTWTPSSVNGWSPDGQYFVFVTEDSTNENTQVYLWSYETEGARLIHTLNNDQSFQNVNWLSDSTGVYFTSGESSWQYEAIWFYDVESNDLKLVVPTSN